MWHPYPLADTGGPGQFTLLRSDPFEGRELLAALPPGYAEADARYPAVYLHDGQNLFDPATSFAGDWGLIARLNVLATRGIRPIVIGIPNRGRRRRREYSPFRDRWHGGGGGGDRYLDFVVGKVKPFIDTSFRTRPERAGTVIGGSSLGGLISLYALYRHPESFGAASVQSPALWYARRGIFKFLERQLPGVRGRIHLDIGTAEGEAVVADVRELRELLLSAGYVEGRDLSYCEDAGAGHTEAAWGHRFAAALAFLLGNRESEPSETRAP